MIGIVFSVFIGIVLLKLAIAGLAFVAGAALGELPQPQPTGKTYCAGCHETMTGDVMADFSQHQYCETIPGSW
jgi:hypothetical protein